MKSFASQSRSVREAPVRLIRDYGVWNALNLDGGGSTSMDAGSNDRRRHDCQHVVGQPERTIGWAARSRCSRVRCGRRFNII